MYIFLVVLLVLFGIAMLVAEMFLLPGFGIAGVSGFASLAAAVIVAYLCISPLAGHVVLAACLALTALAIYGFFRSHAIEKMALDTTIDSQVNLAPAKKEEPKKAETKNIEKTI